MYISRKKIVVYFLTAVLFTGLSAQLAYAYDGDVDYLAPYVTLDPESGKLVTVDPRKDQAAAAELQKQHDAAAAGTTTDSTSSTTTATSGTDTSVTAMPAPGDTGQQNVAMSPGTAIIGVISVILIIGVVVAMTRKKSVPKVNDGNS